MYVGFNPCQVQIGAAPAPQVGLSGLGCGCAGLGCSCNQGLGLFDMGFDWTRWTWQEWATAGAAAYVFLSVVFSTRRGYERVRKTVRRRR